MNENPGQVARRTRHLYAAFAITASSLALTFASGAGAQTASDAAVAQELYDQAKAMMKDGRTAEACPKLEESQRLDPSSGTLLNLALCYEQTGRLASAWSRYVEAASASAISGNTARETEARTRAAELRPRLAMLVIEVPSEVSVTPGLQINRNGERVGNAQWGVAVPVDPGEHIVTASAPGVAPWETVAAVQGDAARVSVTVPALKAEGATGAGGPGLGTQRILALVAGGVGVVGLGVGTVFGIKSKSHHDEAAEFCEGSECTAQRGIDAGTDAYAAGNVATIGMVVGGVGLAAGVTLWLTAKDEGSAPTTGAGARRGLALEVGPGNVNVRGAF